MVKRSDRKKKVVEVEYPKYGSNLQHVHGWSGPFGLSNIVIPYRDLFKKMVFMYIVFHLFDIICVEAWLLYRRDCVISGVIAEMPLFDFISELAQCLSVAPIKRKVGRCPSLDAEMQSSQTTQRSNSCSTTTRYSLRSERSDDIGPHMPNEQDANYKGALDLPKSRAISA